MKKIIFCVAALALCFVFVQATQAGQYGGYGDVHVDGYYRQDGTYVQPHVRSRPDGNPYNN